MSRSYWDRRAEADMDIVQNQAERRLRTIGNAIQDSQRYLTEEAMRILKRYQLRFGLTREQAEAYLAEPITRAEYGALLQQLATMPESPEKVILEALANRGAYAYRITRAEALRTNIAVETAKVAQVIEDETTGQLRFTAVEAFDRRMFAVQQQTGQAFASPDVGSLNVALDTPWSGKSYSEAVWGDHREALAKAIEEKITSGFLSGKPYRKIAKDIQDEFGVTFRQAERLVRTETSYVSNQADIAAYKKAGIEWYRFTATLDDRTCDHCGPMDLEIFEVAKAAVGVNLPPLHPWCRCTTVAAIDKDRPLAGQRFARNANGNGIKVPRDMSFEEWREWQKAGAPGDIKAWRGEQDKDAKPLGVEFTPAETLAEAEAFARDKLRLNGVYYKGLDIRTANEMNQAITEGMRYAPEIADAMKFAGSTQQRNSALRKDEGLVEAVLDDLIIRNPGYSREALRPYAKQSVSGLAGKVKAENYATAFHPLTDMRFSNMAEYYNARYVGIGVNEKAGKQYELFTDSLTQDVSAAFHPVGTGTVKAVFDHEIGHKVDEALGIRSNSELLRVYQSLSAQDIQAGLSRYATKNIAEFIAEAYSEYLNNPNPRDIAKKVGRIIDSRAGR